VKGLKVVKSRIGFTPIFTCSDAFAVTCQWR